MIQYLKCETGFKEIEKWESDCWINVVNPTKDDISTLVSHFNVLDYFFEDVSDNEERARIDRDEGWLLTIIRVPTKYLDNDDEPVYTTCPVGIMKKGSVFITVYYGQNNVISNFINWSNQKKIQKLIGFDLYLSIFLESTFWFLKYLKQIHAHIKNAEESLSENLTNDDLLRIMHLEKFLVYFTSSLKDNETVLMRIKKLLTKDTYDEDLLDDLEVELSQALHTTKIYSDILEHEQNSYSSIINNGLNHTMKKMTIITICLMVAALVPGFYGMNLVNGMEQWAFGFPVAICITILCAIASFFLCKRLK